VDKDLATALQWYDRAIASATNGSRYAEFHKGFFCFDLFDRCFCEFIVALFQAISWRRAENIQKRLSGIRKLLPGTTLMLKTP